MKFLLDVNVGTTIAEAIRLAGHGVDRVGLKTPKAADVDILSWASRRDCVLVTYDSDFTDLIFRDGAPPPKGMIYIRVEPQDMAQIIPRILPLLDESVLSGHVAVLGRSETRLRAFPSGSNDNG